jgi:hypothetical protein
MTSETKVSFTVPQVIAMNDYHEFKYLESIFRDDLGMKNITITEVGFREGLYLGVIHVKGQSRDMITKMKKELEDS